MIRSQALACFELGRVPDLDPGQGNKARNERKTKLRSTTRTQHGRSTMDRDTLLFRVSLIWLAIIAAGCVYVLLKL
jgi:hypothetical protein